MKTFSRTQKIFPALALTCIFGSAPSAMARPFDLVIYDEGKQTYALSVDKSDSNQITLSTCSKDEWVDAMTQCKVVKNVGKISDFKNLVTKTAILWAQTFPGQPLAPLKPTELSALLYVNRMKADNSNAAALAELADLQARLDKTKNMLQHVPDSEFYKKQQAEIQASIQKVQATTGTYTNALSQAASLDALITDLSNEMVKLIQTNNPKTGQLNFYLNSKMQNTLLAMTMRQLITAKIGKLSEAGVNKIHNLANNEDYTVTTHQGSSLEIYTPHGSVGLSSEPQACEPVLVGDNKKAIYIAAIHANQNMYVYKYYQSGSVQIASASDGLVSLDSITLDKDQITVSARSSFGFLYKKVISSDLKANSAWILQ